MPTLAELDLKQSYRKPEDDIAAEFYLPCLSRARRYDRAVGYFSSAIYTLAWPSLRTFVDDGGKMRMICSPVVNEADAAALAAGEAARTDAVASRLLAEELRKLLASPATAKPTRVLAALVALGHLEFRIAWVGDVASGQLKRLFHDKAGIFIDAEQNAVAFKGSMNETWPGLARDGNLESVDVFLSWAGERERKRVLDEQQYFERLWKNEYTGVTTVDLPVVFRDELLAVADRERWRELVGEICEDLDAARERSPEKGPGGRVPRPHQLAALEQWEERGRRGIFEHATGSGKTFTALCAIEDALKRGETPLVLVPSDLLLAQWTDELRATFAQRGLCLLLCGGGHSDWRSRDLLRAWTRPQNESPPRAVLATMQTAASAEFLTRIRAGEHLFLVADEVHRLGAPAAQRIFDLESGPRLGLSATPERAGDPAGTAAIFGYFGGVVPPPFTLFDAISAGALTPYSYHVHRISLEQDEQDRWYALSKDVSRAAARLHGKDQRSEHGERLLRQLLIRRARIVKGARRKVEAAATIVLSAYVPGQRWIVYCDDQNQLAVVRSALRAAGIRDLFEYHSAMVGDPRRTLRLFESGGGVVVSIRCLDEGVDIPTVSHALILASSRNPREFIQRRGRVLRRAEGKPLATIHDVVVTPMFDPHEPPATAILEGELARALEFGSHAINPGCVTEMERLAIEHGLDWQRLTGAGIEEEDEVDNDAACER